MTGFAPRRPRPNHEGVEMTDRTAETMTNASLIATAHRWAMSGHDVALAIVIQTWGSSPRPVGSVMGGS